MATATLNAKLADGDSDTVCLKPLAGHATNRKGAASALTREGF